MLINSVIKCKGAAKAFSEARFKRLVSSGGSSNHGSAAGNRCTAGVRCTAGGRELESCEITVKSDFGKGV